MDQIMILKIKYKRYIFPTFILLLTLFLALFVFTKGRLNHKIQEGIAEEIIRFHVIAHSNDDKDQDLKHAVKLRLNQYLSPLLSNAPSKDEARKIIFDHIPDLTVLAKEIVTQYGYTYKVNIALKDSFFPLRTYDNYSFPPGVYESLRVEIGDFEGENWWCVMFPPLCFVDETYALVPDSSQAKLEDILADEELEAIIDEEITIKYKFKILTFFNRFMG